MADHALLGLRLIPSGRPLDRQAAQLALFSLQWTERKMFDSFSDRSSWPGVGDPERLTLNAERWRESLSRHKQEDWAGKAESLFSGEAGRALLEALFSNSPYLSDCALSDPPFFVYLAEQGPEAALEQSDALLREAMAASGDLPAAMRALRRAKKRLALATGLADISNSWPLERITGALSEFAARASGEALGFLLRQAEKREELTFAEGEDRLAACGYFLLAMGKLGAGELNYSSDIDLIALYDPEKAPLTGKRHHQELFVRLTRDFARLLDERTGDGYVFRVDFRLRPDPAAMPLALTVQAAEIYYESLGQNWERAAMIKASVLTGDRTEGEAFLAALRPFVWRRHLDFWAIKDVHSIKRQIHAAKGGGNAIAVEGHNIKLGRGGIREIEFFVQTQQLIFGGRDPSLRCRGTLEGLQALAKAERIEQRTADELSEAYRDLRRVEHRLQMIEDQQTHSIPARPEALEQLAIFLGFSGAAAFREHLLERLGCVERHYARLFEEEPDLAGPGNLVFTGGETDPDTMKTLADLGFEDGERVYNLVKGWHHGRYRALRATRARQILTELMPTLLQELGATAAPDEAIVRFDSFLKGLPAGVQLFSMIYSNPSILNLLAEIMGSAPALSEHLSRKPGLMDAVLSGDFFDPLPDRAGLAQELQELLATARDYQDVLDLSRRWANDRRFQVGVQLLRHTVEVGEAGRAFSRIAEVTIAAVYPAVRAQIEEAHGRPDEKGLAIVALGKLGAREMTPTSDLDLVFLYDTDPNGASDGRKPLAASQFYARLGQRMITALSAMTGEGLLYEIDMRLRPSGNAGPLALSLAGFERYQTSEAWTWEHMALTRARVISAEEGLRHGIEDCIARILTAQRDPEALLRDVASMRARIAREFKAKSPWEVKHWRGGLVDLDFVVQYLILRHCHERPDLIEGNSLAALAKLAEAGFLEQEEARTLAAAAELLQALQSLLRLTMEGRFEEESAPDGMKQALAKACGALDFAELKSKLKNANGEILAAFERHIAKPAGALPDASERE
jgi:glutamate-ammonia-ligase adenylyltransferase